MPSGAPTSGHRVNETVEHMWLKLPNANFRSGVEDMAAEVSVYWT